MGFKSCTSTPELFSSYLAAPPRNKVLEHLAGAVDWAALRTLMAPAYKDSRAGREGFDPVVLFKILLLEFLYDLSDVRVVEEVADRLSFRQFLGLGPGDTAPDDTTLVKFRKRLRDKGLFDRLFAEVWAQMDEKGLGVRQGSIKVVDATLVQAAVRPPSKPGVDDEGNETAPARPALDPDADWTVKRGKPLYGFKVHLAQDRETGLVSAPVVTSASVHDTNVFAELLDGGEAEVLADKGYDSDDNRRALKAQGTAEAIMRRARRGKPLSKWREGRNKSIGRVRSFIEGANGGLKRWRRMGRAVYVGLERFWTQALMSVLAHNCMRWAALAGGRCAQ